MKNTARLFFIGGITLTIVYVLTTLTGDSRAEEVIVYETEVTSADDCTSFEEYDAAAQVCYFECATESECDAVLSEIDAELESWTDTLEEPERSFSEAEALEEDFLAAYSVSATEAIELIEGEAAAEYLALWQEVAELSPDSLSSTFIEQFAVFDDESSDTLAYVSDEDGNGKWLMAINLATHATSTIREQKSTIIHELAHILTLNSSQILPNLSTCATFEIAEGCAKDTSYLYNFYSRFWEESPNQSYSPSTFVTEYAATNTEEDVAESFAFFVLESNFHSTTVRDQKVAFFAQYPELATARADMRRVLAREIVRERRLR